MTRMMIICITEKNIPEPHRYSMGSCQFSKLYFHYFLFIPLIRIVAKLMRGKKKKPQYKLAVKRDVFLLITILSKGRVGTRGTLESDFQEDGVRWARVCQGKSYRVS